MTTRRGLLTIAGGVAAAGALPRPARAATHRSGPASQEAAPQEAALQAALDDFAGTGAVGVLAEMHHRGGVWRGSAGSTRLGSPQRAAGSFRAGSITKPFVATVVLQLAADRRLALDDTLQRWLPGVLPYGDRVTVRHLLTHTSGVHDYTRSPAFTALYQVDGGFERMRLHSWQPRELVAFIDDQPPLWVPGTSFRYSNTNYLLLGMLIERVTGTPWATEVSRRVLRPLGLRHTRLPGDDPYLPGPHLHGYVPLATPLDVAVVNPSVAGAAGEVISTTADLSTFFRTLISGRLLHPAALRLMLTAGPATPDYDYGLGLMTRTLPGGTRLWGHRGNFLDAYYTESWTTGTGDRQLTVAATPRGESDPKQPITALLELAFERPAATIAPRESSRAR